MHRLKVGFIGLGKMGSFMASNLLKKGIKLWIVDTDLSMSTSLIQQGAQVTASPAHLGLIPGLNVIISMLPSPAIVRDVYLNESYGLFSTPQQSLHPHIIIDSSTIDPNTSKSIASRAESVQLHPDAVASTGHACPLFIDAPVSGGTGAAESGTLTFICGGKPAAVQEATPLLNIMGRKVIHCGPSGSGTAAKLANNLVMGICMAAVAEGLSFGEKQGIDPGLLTSIFNSSSAQCWSSEKYNPVPGVMDGVPSSRGYAGGFSSSFVIKDLKLALDAAKQCHANVFLTEHAKSLYDKVVERSSPNTDFSAIYQFVYKNNE